MTSKITALWHGGRNLEHNWRSFQESKKGRWEYGPGLYLTSGYEIARQFAKGGGKTYLVLLEEGNSAENTDIRLSDMLDFASKHVVKSKIKPVSEDLHDHAKRIGATDSIKAEILINLIINHDAIPTSKTKLLNSFLVECGIDYSATVGYGMQREHVVVVFNNSKILKAAPVPAKDVSLDMYHMPFEFGTPEETIAKTPAADPEGKLLNRLRLKP